jgi:gliding motility-associated-like protein
VVSPGIYQLVAVNFCGSDTTEIEVQDLPGVQISAVGLTQLSICADSQVTLQVNSNLPVFWSNGLSGNSITVNQPGVYAAISVNECDSAFIDFFVSELPNPIAIINESGPINLCAGDLTQLSTDSEGEILWSNGSTENSIIVSESGTYTLTVSNGCGSASSTIFVNNQSVIASFQADPVSGTAPLSVNFTNFTQGATQWNWNLGDGSFSTNENPSNIYNNAGQYEVVLAVNNGFCTDSTSITIIVFDDFELMIPNVFSPNNDGINDEFLISASGVKDFNVKIYNRWGNLVFTSQNSLDSWKGQNNAGGLSSDGVYFYILDVTKLNNEKVQLTGNVTLVR